MVTSRWQDEQDGDNSNRRETEPQLKWITVASLPTLMFISLFALPIVIGILALVVVAVFEPMIGPHQTWYYWMMATAYSFIGMLVLVIVGSIAVVVYDVKSGKGVRWSVVVSILLYLGLLLLCIVIILAGYSASATTERGLNEYYRVPAQHTHH